MAVKTRRNNTVDIRNVPVINLDKNGNVIEDLSKVVLPDDKQHEVAKIMGGARRRMSNDFS